LRIGGIQKMTLLDFPEKVAATVFLQGCNFRCPFCHNASLVTHIGDDYNSPEEVLRFLEKRKGLLDGVCISGGEPLMAPDIGDFIKDIRNLGFAVKVDTNGSFPHRLSALIENSLVDYVAMDVKNCPERYAETVGIPDFDLTPIGESISLLLSGKIDFEFRTTVTAELHTPEGVAKIAEWIAGAPRYFLQNFEDSGDIIGKNQNPVPEDLLRQMENSARVFVKNTSVRNK